MISPPPQNNYFLEAISLTAQMGSNIATGYIVGGTLVVVAACLLTVLLIAHLRGKHPTQRGHTMHPAE